MGVVQFGGPKQIILFLQETMGLKVFIEGGTYQGNTAKWAAGHFQQVFTIENSDAMRKIAAENLKDTARVTMLAGDTRNHLEPLLAANDDLLFWLDAHWSGGLTFGEGSECPLLEELSTIFAQSRNQAILIDDARLFLSPPPRPHQIDQWPTLQEVVAAIPSGWDLVCHDDVLIIIPETISHSFRQFVQELVSQPKVAAPTKRRLLSRLRKVG